MQIVTATDMCRADEDLRHRAPAAASRHFFARLGTRIDISDDLRRVNQRLIRERIAEVAAFYHFTP